MDLILKLDPSEELSQARIVTKLNEIIEAVNTLIEPAAKDWNAVNNLHPLGAKMYAACQSETSETTIVDCLKLWAVEFYDDVTHDWNSPVYCVKCEFQSVSLLDRMMLDPHGLCEGCAYKSAHG